MPRIDRLMRAGTGSPRWPETTRRGGALARTADIILCIDIEPNERQVNGVAEEEWSATGPVIALLQHMLRGSAKTGDRPVHMSWFVRMDPQIAESYGRADFIVQRYRDEMDSFRAAGDEIGLHVHAWKKDAEKGWFAAHGDRAWVQHCVDRSWRAYEEAFGRAPRAFRFGDHFLDNDVVRQLDQLRVAFDLTVEPGIESMKSMRLNEDASGQLPDYTHFPRAPYRPSRRDFGTPGGWWPRRLWMIPVSTGCPDGPDVAPPSGGGKRFYHLNLAGDPALNQRLFDGLLALEPNPLIVWVARTGDYAFPAFKQNYESNLRLIAEHPLRSSFSFLRPDEAVPRSKLRRWLGV